MKLSSLLVVTGSNASLSPLEKMQSISAAHSAIRNGFNRPQFDAYRREHETLFKEITQKGVRSDPEFIMAKAENLTVTFRSEPEGISIGSFPALDGSNNDLTGQMRGKVGDRYSRLVPPEYCQFDADGFPSTDLQGQPRCKNHKEFGSHMLPNERDLSLAITATNGNDGKTTEDGENSMIGPLWGQFVTHDIIQTPDMGAGSVKCDCSNIAECKNIGVDKTTDPHFDDIDYLSQVYGASQADLDNLIHSDKMHLKTRSGVDGAEGNVGDILPFTSDAKSQSFANKFKQPSTFNDDNFKDFIAGDTRVEENPYLASFHTIFVRYHNLMVDGLRKQRPDWSKKEIFENARMITISVFKNIHYGEALPQMLGDKLNVVPKRYYVSNILKLKFMDQVSRKGKKFNGNKNTRSEITQIEYELGKRPFNEFQRRPLNSYHKHHRLMQENDNMRGIKFRQTGHEAPHPSEPSIRNEFATAGYRMHGQVSALMKAMNDEWNLIKHQHSDLWHSDDASTDPNEEGLAPGERELLDGTGLGKMKYNFFDPEWVHTKGPGGCLRGSMKSSALKMDGTFDPDLQHHLFKPDNWHHGVDLFAINIARGRDHGIGSYGALRAFCKSHEIYRKFYAGKMNDANLFINLDQITHIRNMYISEEEARSLGKQQDDFIDLYVGMQLETHMEGATVGPTAGCIIAEQFAALKTGDRFWFENNGVFSVDQMAEIRKMTLGAVSCATFEGAGPNSLMAINPFKASGDVEGDANNLKRCKDFQQVDFTKWGEPTDEPTEEEAEQEPVVAACVWVTKAKAIDCSNLNWGDDELEAYTANVKRTRKFAVLGRNSVIKFISKNQVKRVSLAGNRISNLEMIEELTDIVKSNLLELSFAKNPSIAAETNDVLGRFVNYDKLGHLDVGDTGIDCLPVSVLTKLSTNLVEWNRLVFLNSNERMAGRKL